MATATTYDLIGVKEDISDVISNISPTKTPFQSGIGSDSTKQKLFQWQEDALRAQASNTQLEGADPTDITVAPTVMRDNVCQILFEAVKVAATPDASDYYGRAKETAYQLAKSAAALKRDLEHAFVGSAQAKVAPVNNASARVMAGYQTQINTSGTSQVVYTGAGPAPLSEAPVLTLLQRLYNEGADPAVISVSPNNALIVADFAKATGRGRSLTSESSVKEQATIVNTVDVYVSPFGRQNIILNRFQKLINTLIYDPENWVKMVLRPWTRETLAKTGDATKMMLVGEFSLKHKNFRSSGVIVEGTTGF